MKTVELQKYYVPQILSVSIRLCTPKILLQCYNDIRDSRLFLVCTDVIKYLNRQWPRPLKEIWESFKNFLQ